jgi:tripartite motif-containing protein 71
VWVADRGNDRVRSFSPDGTPLVTFGMRGVGPGQFVEPAGIAVDCHGLVTVAEADNNRVQQFQVPPVAGCAALPPVVNPPDPILATQPQPLPPDLSVTPTRTTAILSIRQFPLKIRSDLPCRIAVEVKLSPRSGKRPKPVTLSFPAQSLPAGRTVTVRPRLSVAGVRALAKQLKGKRGLYADVKVTASTDASAPAVIENRVKVTG